MKQSDITYVISLRGVHKAFRRCARTSYTTFKSRLLSLFKKSSPTDAPETVALKDITLRVPKGASVGVIGKNGSGKSTLLKLITGIYKPDSGTVSCTGKISALIELGAGFHPDFTGRENVYLGGMIQGLSRKEVRDRFDDIVRFAELEDFIDEPVRTYSSGMYIRLGFSVAIHADPDVLLVDEVLAVGDEGFISKCKGKISELKSRGVTLMLVTHDLAAVERWCDEVLWLEKGEVVDRGDPRRVIDAYRQFIEGREESELERENIEREHSDTVTPGEESQDEEVTHQDKIERWGSREIEITAIRLLDNKEKEHYVYHPKESCSIEIDYKIQEEIDGDIEFGVAIHHNDGTLIFGTNTDIEKQRLPELPEIGTIKCTIPSLTLLSGEYWIDVAAHRDDGYPYDYWKRCLHFAVRSSETQVGRLYLETQWEARGVEMKLAANDKSRSVENV